MTDLYRAARPSFDTIARRVEQTMGGIRGGEGAIKLRDLVTATDSEIHLEDLITTTVKGSRSFAWCEEASCPIPIVPITIELDKQGSTISTAGMRSGLYRLKLLGRVAGEMFYLPEEAWVLITVANKISTVREGLNNVAKELGTAEPEEVRLATRMLLANNARGERSE